MQERIIIGKYGTLSIFHIILENTIKNKMSLEARKIPLNNYNIVS